MQHKMYTYTSISALTHAGALPKSDRPGLEISTSFGVFHIPASAKWAVREQPDYTELYLEKEGHPLDGLCVPWDWSQGFCRPEKKSDRIASLIGDVVLMQYLAEHLLERQQA